MDIKDALRRQRARGQQKIPLPPSLFSHLGGLVRRHGLGEPFAHLLGSLTDQACGNSGPAIPGGGQGQLRGPLFFLATPAEYRLILRIMAAPDNSYLALAHSPEEILLARPLCLRHPGLAPELLASRHFAALW